MIEDHNQRHVFYDQLLYKYTATLTVHDKNGKCMNVALTSTSNNFVVSKYGKCRYTHLEMVL